MIGRSIPRIAYDGINKERWIEGNNSFQRVENELSSTYVKVELLALRGKSEREKRKLQIEINKYTPVAFVDLGKIDLSEEE